MGIQNVRNWKDLQDWQWGFDVLRGLLSKHAVHPETLFFWILPQMKCSRLQKIISSISRSSNKNILPMQHMVTMKISEPSKPCEAKGLTDCYIHM